MALSTGDFLFVFNSWAWRSEALGASPVYEPAWAILDKDDPTHVLAEATQPLTQPSAAPWMEGVPPYTCNVPRVAFVEAMHATDQKDEFRIFLGGADAVVGTALVRVTGLA